MARLNKVLSKFTRVDQDNRLYSLSFGFNREVHEVLVQLQDRLSRVSVFAIMGRVLLLTCNTDAEYCGLQVYNYKTGEALAELFVQEESATEALGRNWTTLKEVTLAGRLYSKLDVN